MSTHSSSLSPATASEIRDIIGPLEDDVIERIMSTGATSAEVLDAYTWRRSDQRMQRSPHYELHGRAAHVLAILETEEPDADE